MLFFVFVFSRSVFFPPLRLSLVPFREGVNSVARKDGKEKKKNVYTRFFLLSVLLLSTTIYIQTTTKQQKKTRNNF